MWGFGVLIVHGQWLWKEKKSDVCVGDEEDGYHLSAS